MAMEQINKTKLNLSAGSSEEDEIIDLLEALYNLILNNIEDQYKKSQS